MVDEPLYLQWHFLLGGPLVHFLLGIEVDSPEELDARQRSALRRLDGMVGRLEASFPILPVALARLTNADALPVCWDLRRSCGGDVPAAFGEDEAERMLSTIARDVYCVLLSPPDLVVWAGPGRSLPAADPMIGLDHLVVGHPLAAQLTELLRDQAAGLITKTLVSAMGASRLADALEPNHLLGSAAARWYHRTGADAQTFMGEAVACLRDVRSIRRGEVVSVPAFIGFSGLPLRPGGELRLSAGLVRPPTAAERRYAPFGRFQSGDFFADAVMEIDTTAQLVVGQDQSLDAQIQEQARLNSLGRNFCLAAALALEGAPASCPAIAWVTELPPVVGKSSYRPGRPTQPPARADMLEEAELERLREWFEHLAAADLSRVEIAIERILRACWERDWTESLIDAVIAWENLFGSRPDTTFRVTAALTVLCEDDPDARLAKRRRLAKVYDARSSIVHGDISSDNLYELREEAVAVGLEAFRRLIQHRPDLLKLAKSSARGDRLLLAVPIQR